jgi:spore germination protein
MLSSNERITLRQLQILIIISSLGTGLIVLPRRVAEFASHDGWIIVLGLTVLGMGLAALMVAAARVKPGAAFIEYAGFALTRPVAYLCGVFLWVKLVAAAGFELQIFLVITKRVLLNDTPIYIVSALMLAVCAYAAVKGIETRARVAEVLTLVLVLPLVFLFAIALMDMDLSNLRPVLVTPPERLLSGTLRLGFVFTGLECLLLASPYIAPGKKMGRAVVCAVGFAGLLITAITVITLAKFGAGVADEPWPVLRMMDMLNLPGSFIERQEALMFSFWIVTVFALVNALIFFGGSLLADIFRFAFRNSGHTRKRPRCFGIVVTVFAVFAVTCIPREGEEIYKRLDWMYYTGGVFFMAVFPVLVLLGAGLRKWIKKWRNPLACILLAVPLLTFTGCYDNMEIENRAFVVAIGLDKADDHDKNGYRYTVSVSGTLGGRDEEDDGSEKHIKKASAKTLTEAMHKLDKEINNRFYYGQAKIIVLGEGLLEDAELVRNTLSVFMQNPEIDRQIKIYAENGNATDLKEDCFFRLKEEMNFSQDLETVHTQLNYTGSSLITTTSHGAILIKGFKKTGALTPDELRGYLWCFTDKNKNAVITANYNGAFIPLTIEKHTADIIFKPSYPTPKVVIDFYAEGRISENPGISVEFAKLLLEKEIVYEIRKTAEKLQNANLDAYQWQAHLRKKQYALYQRYGRHWDDIFPRLEIEPRVTVRIKS